MLRFRIVIVSLFILLEFGLLRAYAHDIDINFGKVYISPEQNVSNLDPIYTKNYSAASPCNVESLCQITSVAFSQPAEAPVIDGFNPIPGHYNLVKIGNTGISIGYKILDKLRPQTRQTIEFSLFKTSDTIQSGTININLRVLQLEYYRSPTFGRYSQTYNFYIKAQINSGGCILNSKNLSFSLPPINSNSIGKLPLNSRIEQGHTNNTLLAKCSGVDGIGLSFFSGNTTDNQEVLNAKLASGENSGLGFMLFYTNNGVEKPIKWGVNNSINITNPKDVSIPISAYYTKVSDNLKPGNVSANGTFVINYQ